MKGLFHWNINSRISASIVSSLRSPFSVLKRSLFLTRNRVYLPWWLHRSLLRSMWLLLFLVFKRFKIFSHDCSWEIFIKENRCFYAFLNNSHSFPSNPHFLLRTHVEKAMKHREDKKTTVVTGFFIRNFKHFSYIDAWEIIGPIIICLITCKYVDITCSISILPHFNFVNLWVPSNVVTTMKLCMLFGVKYLTIETNDFGHYF